LEGLFEDLVRFIYPPIDGELDVKRGFVLLDRELKELDLERGERDAMQVNKLVKVFRADGQEDWLLLHIEEMADKHLPERIFRHYCRIWARCERRVAPFAIVVGTEGVCGRLAFLKRSIVLEEEGMEKLFEERVRKLREN
jgi:hypothetical protein